METAILEKSGSSAGALFAGRPERKGFARRVRSWYEQMKELLRSREPAWEEDSILGENGRKWQQAIAGYFTGKILMDLGVISGKQLGNALERQKDLQQQGRRKSLGILLVEMGYTTSKQYLEALSEYFGLPTISLARFIPSPALQGTLANRYSHYHKLLVLADYEAEVTLALAEPDPLILEELKKTFRKKMKINLYLANPFEMERCHRLYLDPFSTNFYR